MPGKDKAALREASPYNAAITREQFLFYEMRTTSPATPPQPKKIIKTYNRQIIFPAKRLESEADIDNYVEKIRDQLKQLLKNCDGIQLK